MRLSWFAVSVFDVGSRGSVSLRIARRAMRDSVALRGSEESLRPQVHRAQDLAAQDRGLDRFVEDPAGARFERLALERLRPVAGVDQAGQAACSSAPTPSLVTVGLPNDFSMITLRPRGPSVTFTALASF